MPFLHITTVIKIEIYNFGFGQPEFEIKFLYKMMNASTFVEKTSLQTNSWMQDLFFAYLLRNSL